MKICSLSIKNVKCNTQSLRDEKYFFTNPFYGYNINNSYYNNDFKTKISLVINKNFTGNTITPHHKKRWNNEETKSLIFLYEKKVPIKIIARLFEVSENAISKTLQRYSMNHSHLLENKIPNIYENMEQILQWMDKNYLLFYEIIHSNWNKIAKTIATNKILYRNKFKVLSPIQVEVLLFRLQIIKNHCKNKK